MVEAKRKRTPLTPYGRYIRNRLMDLNMTQRELADLLHMQRQHLSGLMHGAWPGLMYRAQIEAILGGKPPRHIENKIRKDELHEQPANL